MAKDVHAFIVGGIPYAVVSNLCNTPSIQVNAQIWNLAQIRWIIYVDECQISIVI